MTAHGRPGETADGDGPAGGGHDDDWRARRAERADALGDALARRQAAESARASAMLAAFVAEAAELGPPPVALHARGAGGRGRYRTHLTGWYLRRDERAAVATDGRFYLLTVPGGLGAVVRGVRPQPSDPPLVLGRGSRDGESIDLADVLARLRAQR